MAERSGVEGSTFLLSAVSYQPSAKACVSAVGCQPSAVS